MQHPVRIPSAVSNPQDANLHLDPLARFKNNRLYLARLPARLPFSESPADTPCRISKSTTLDPYRTSPPTDRICSTILRQIPGSLSDPTCGFASITISGFAPNRTNCSSTHLFRGSCVRE